MHQLLGLIHYVRDNPMIALLAVVAVVGIARLLNRKPKLSREADERLNKLREERGDVYKNLRPLR
jgi:hypothetical protein